MSRLPDFAAPPPSQRASTPAVLAAALVFGLALADAWLARDLATGTEARVASLQAETVALRVRVDRLRAAVRRGADAPALGALTVPPAVILDHVASRLPADVRLTDFEVRYLDAARIRLAVEARTPEAWDRLLAALAASPRLRELRPSPERREHDLRASITATWVDEGAQ